MGKKKKHGRRGSMTLPIAVVAPIAIVAYSLSKPLMAGGAGREDALASLTGFHGSNKFNMDLLWPTYGPIAAGFVIHAIASKIGVNRALGRAKVPFIRI